MPRVKRGFTTHRRHANVLERAKGFRTGRGSLFKRASEALLKAESFAYRDRRNKKRDIRRGWILRVNNAVRMYGMTYSTFMDAMKKKGIAINRKMLADMAMNDIHAIEQLVKKVSK